MNGVLVLVDDDLDVLKINTKYLTKAGYEVHPFNNGSAVLKHLDEIKPDCLILDVMMPGLDGLSLCSAIRKKYDTPIIFLTGKGSEDDKIQGLLTGGDDYMVKPYSLRELEARIHVHIRRKNTQPKNDSLISYPPLSIDFVKHKAYYLDQEIQLSNREYELLLLLAQSPGKTFLFEEIGAEIWGNYSEQDRRAIMVNASRLRKKLEEFSGCDNFIETVWSKGYKFVPPTH